jgi:TolB-like protein/DNA-binding winged helix-turn-helix (wHTH) protein/Tfp pilus assembly protein PilF
MSTPAKHLYEFGPFLLDEAERRLLRDGEPVPLTPKAFGTLLALVRRGGRVVGKDELLGEVWPDTFVEEGGLARNISVLRKALGDDAAGLRYIETVPKLGYRFVAEVRKLHEGNGDLIVERHVRASVVTEEEVGIEADASPTAPQAPRAGGGHKGMLRRLGLLALAAVLAGLTIALAYSWVSRRPERAEAGAAGARAIAVLPFKQIGAKEDEELLGLGMADALITKLSNLRQVAVRPTSDVRKYAERQDRDLAAVGRELGVDAVLDGSVQRAGEQLRVTVQLVNAQNGSPLWAGKFDEKFTDLFSVQDSISEQVARALAPQLTGEEKRRLTKRYTDNAEAYQAYVKGRFTVEKKTVDEAHLGIRYFEQAIAKDPSYALAYTGLADAYYTLGDKDPAMSYNEAMAKSRMAAMRALELDDTLAEAHLSLAVVKLDYDWDWPGAEREFTRAIELNPSYTPAHHEFSHYLIAMGRADESLRESNRALELEPLSVKMNVHLAWHYLYTRQYDEAIAQCKKTLEMSPNYIRAHNFMGVAYLKKGMYAEAIRELQKAVSLKGEGMEAVGVLGHAYAAAGRREDALRSLAELRGVSERGYVSPWDQAIIYTGLGDKEQAFYWLEKAYEERHGGMTLLRQHLLLDSLRSDPRFASLVQRVGLAP